jgi:hypothetical protein
LRVALRFCAGLPAVARLSMRSWSRRLSRRGTVITTDSEDLEGLAAHAQDVDIVTV